MSIFSTKRTFRGGVHPDEMKEFTEKHPFEIMSLPKKVIIPLHQHIGKPSKPLVKKGSEVKAGMLLAESEGVVSAPIHSSVNGKVNQIHIEPNPGGFPKEAIIIDTIESDDIELLPKLDINSVTQEEILNRIKEAGIVGQGGAAFPTHVKLSPPPDKKVDCIILNGCECEPYLTRDYRLMIEKPEEVVKGMALMIKAANIKKGFIGVEDNKHDAAEILKKFSSPFGIEVIELKTKYPQGAEKMLIKAAVDREVPPGKLPMDVGVIVQNINTSVAVYDAVVNGMPQIFAALTVTGGGIKKPKNLFVRVGTPLKDVLDYCGGVNDDAVKVVVGGPMMGVAQFDFNAPILKATSGIVVLTQREVNEHPQTPCLKCGGCIDVCPLGLVPTKLARLTELERIEEADEMGITVCMECGTCTFSCPANIPLVQWIRLGKQKAIAEQKKKQSA